MLYLGHTLIIILQWYITTSQMNLDQRLFNEKSLQKTSSNKDTAIILISTLKQILILQYIKNDVIK